MSDSMPDWKKLSLVPAEVRLRSKERPQQQPSYGSQGGIAVRTSEKGLEGPGWKLKGSGCCVVAALVPSVEEDAV